jgi:TRAP-type C4-dicarboxylate transport system permease small subunit
MFLSAAVFVYGGIAVTLNASGQISAAMQLPMECYYACIPIGGALMILYSLDRLFTNISELKEGK